MFYYTYVLKCVSTIGVASFYIGYTSDLRSRVATHKNKLVTATKEYSSITLIYYEACQSKIDALCREKSLKTGYGRAFIKNRLKSALSRV